MSSGLDGVIAAETVLTLVDGARGIWWLRGHGLQEVIAERGYEGAAALLWEGFAGTDLDRPSLRDAPGAPQLFPASPSGWPRPSGSRLPKRCGSRLRRFPT
ncbi:MAG TPA: hypothetical protein VN668_00675 [Stellaceae bacterium]|nr:hypothetical protein [Stellaceae bacterium]